MSTVIVPEIPKAACPNEPGVNTLDVINMDGLVSPLPALDAAPDDWTMSTAPTLVDGVAEPVASWTFDEESCKLVETLNDNGKYDVSIPMKFGKDSADKRNTFRKMANKCNRFAVWITDENGHTKFCIELKFKDTYETGDAAGGGNQNGYDCEFYKTGIKAYTYTAALPS